MEEANESQADAPEKENEESNGRQTKTWFPYITKVQFEKFLSRLESKIPEQIDRDYVRAIIRTPSMIYRFLRGIEAMQLIGRDQSTTPLLSRLVNTETRGFALAEIQRNLYKDLLAEQEKSGEMNDEEIVEYFRDRTGMGRDSANKMKMFFKYLNGEANFSTATDQVGEETAAVEPEEKNEEAAAESDTTKEQPKEEAKEEPKSATPAPRPSRERSQEKTQEWGQERRGGRESRALRSPAPSLPQERERPTRPLTDQQKAYLDTVRSVVSINIDGDWDEDMIRVAFDRLERLLDRIRRI
jgi:hypothetical protein